MLTYTVIFKKFCIILPNLFLHINAITPTIGSQVIRQKINRFKKISQIFHLGTQKRKSENRTSLNSFIKLLQ